MKSMVYDETNLFRRSGSMALDAWKLLDGTSILFSGGTGFFGYWFLNVAKTMEKDHGIKVDFTLITRNSLAFRNRYPELANWSHVEIVETDIRFIDLKGRLFDYIIHGATTSALETYEGETCINKFDTLYYGTRKVCEKLAGFEAKKLLFLSSGAVYGDVNATSNISEDQACSISSHVPMNGLAQGKRVAEYLCCEFSRRFHNDIAIARCFSFIGAELPFMLHYAVGEFVKKALNNEVIRIHSDGTVLRSYQHMSDLSAWIATLLVFKTSHSIYNVGSDHGISISELAKLVVKSIGSSSEVAIERGENSSIGNVPRRNYVPNIDRFKSEFHLGPGLSLVDSIRDYANWIRWKKGN